MDAKSQIRLAKPPIARNLTLAAHPPSVIDELAPCQVSAQQTGAVKKWWTERVENFRNPGADLSVNQTLVVDQLLKRLKSDTLWVVNSRRRNGIILYRGYYAEFAGPGAAVGGGLDQACQKIIPLGNLSLLEPASREEQQKALKIRLQWIRLTQNFTDQPQSIDRAQMILEQFKTYFDQATVDQVPDEAFALMVGVLPQTIHQVRARLARSGLA
jgi:hypothetical protein